jgi:hypothetical protein
MEINKMQRDEKKNENTSLNDGVGVGYGTSAREGSQNIQQSERRGGVYRWVKSLFGAYSSIDNQSQNNQEQDDKNPRNSYR